jgi:hypothetical protein
MFILSSPTFFGNAAILSLYTSIIALACQRLEIEVVDILARIGTAAGAALMG